MGEGETEVLGGLGKGGEGTGERSDGSCQSQFKITSVFVDALYDVTTGRARQEV